MAQIGYLVRMDPKDGGEPSYIHPTGAWSWMRRRGSVRLGWPTIEECRTFWGDYAKYLKESGSGDYLDEYNFHIVEVTVDEIEMEHLG